MMTTHGKVYVMQDKSRTAFIFNMHTTCREDVANYLACEIPNKHSDYNGLIIQHANPV